MPDIHSISEAIAMMQEGLTASTKLQGWLEEQYEAAKILGLFGTADQIDMNQALCKISRAKTDSAFLYLCRHPEELVEYYKR